MASVYRQKLLCLVLTSLVTSACGEGPTYRLEWTLGCASSPTNCTITDVKQCSVVGLDAIDVIATDTGGQAVHSVFPCYSPTTGASGAGPELSPGTHTLGVTGVSPGGQTLATAATVSVTVAESGQSPVSVDLPLPVACADGMDNDRDGFADRFDPGCKDNADPDES
jgi:hypothetical protein